MIYELNTRLRYPAGKHCERTKRLQLARLASKTGPYRRGRLGMPESGSRGTPGSRRLRPAARRRIGPRVSALAGTHALIARSRAPLLRTAGCATPPWDYDIQCWTRSNLSRRTVVLVKSAR